MPTHKFLRFDFISRLSMAAAAVLVLALGTATESASQQRSQAQVEAERKALQQKEADLMKARFVLNRWLNDNEHLLYEAQLTDRAGAARLVLQPVSRSELDEILLAAVVEFDVSRDALLREMYEKDRQVRQMIRTKRLPEIDRRLADIRNQFAKLAARQDRPVARLIPEDGEYIYGGKGKATVKVWPSGEIEEINLNWAQDKDTTDEYNIKDVEWNADISKYEATAYVNKNHEYPNGGIPSQFTKFTVYLEYIPQKRGILVTVKGPDRWRMNGVLLVPKPE